MKRTNNRFQNFLPPAAAFAGLFITVIPALAQTTVFFDDFENGNNDVTVDRTSGRYSQTPDVVTYTLASTSTQANTNLWVRASSGNNSTSNGLIDGGTGGADLGRFTPDGAGPQAYAFRATNAGLTTAAGKIGFLAPGATINVSFDVCVDGWNAGSSYNTSLVLFDDGAARNSDEAATNNTAAVLAQATGTTAATSPYQTITFSYTVGDNVVDNDGAGGGVSTTFLHSLLGKDIGLRFFGGTEYANIDNVKVQVDYSGVAFWDTNNSTNGAGGASPSGIWDAAATNWNPLPAGTGTVAAWDPGNLVVFAAGTDATGSYTVTIDGSRDISGLYVEEGNVNLANGVSGALNMTDNSTILVNSGSSATFGAPLTDADDTQIMQKVGSGLLVLSADNSAANGGILVAGGAIQFESSSSINGSAENVEVASGGAVVFGSSFGAGNVTTALTDRIVTTSTGTIATDNYAATDFDFNNAGLTAARLGAVGSVSYTGTVTPSGTTYRLGGGGGTLTLANTNALTGAGNSAIIQGKIVLAGANDYNFGTTLNGGANLTLGNNNSIGGGALTIAAGSTIQASATVVTTNTVAANADFTVAGSNALTLGTVIVNNNRAITNINTAATTLGAIGVTSGNRTLIFNGNGNTTVSGDITTGTGALTKNGTGILTFSGANTYSGATMVSGGTLVLSGSNSTAGTTSLNGATLQLNSASNGGLASGLLTITQNASVLQPINADRSISNSVLLNSSPTISGSKSLTIDGMMTLNANRTLTNSITEIGKLLTLSDITRDGIHNRNLSINGAGNTTVTGDVVLGTGTLTKSGTGSLTLNGTNSYTGDTTVNTGGALALVGGSQTSAVTVNNGAFLGFTVGSPTTSTKAVTLGATAKVRITGTPSAPTSYTLLTTTDTISGTLVLETAITGYELQLAGGNTQLRLVYTGAGGNLYDTWAGTFGGFSNPVANVDFDNGGLATGVEWVLGGDPTNGSDDSGLAPTLDTSDPNNFVFSFRRSDDAAADSNTTIKVEYGSNLTGWTPAMGGVDEVSIDDSAVPAAGFHNVVVTIPKTLAVGGKLFARLNVVVTTP